MAVNIIGTVIGIASYIGEVIVEDLVKDQNELRELINQIVGDD